MKACIDVRTNAHYLKRNGCTQLRLKIESSIFCSTRDKYSASRITVVPKNLRIFFTFSKTTKWGSITAHNYFRIIFRRLRVVTYLKEIRMLIHEILNRQLSYKVALPSGFFTTTEEHKITADTPTRSDTARNRHTEYWKTRKT